MAVALFSVLLPAVSATTLWAQVNVPTWRYDNTHQGQNTQETILTPTNVNTNTFGKLFSQPVDGEVYAQPLYVSNLTVNGATHNVLFVATEHDSVYAFDADSNGGANSAPLWQASMLSTAHGAGSGATTMPSSDVQSGTGDIHPEIGITGTPVIDLATQTLFVLAKTKENGSYFQRLHALNILTGAERSGSPVALSGSVPGNGNGSSGGNLAFSVLWQNNRVAMDLFNGNLYLGFGSHGDDGPWHGWVLVYNETTLAQTAAICTSPNGNGDGIWSSGAAFPIDTVSANGRAFVVTGNGDYTSYPPLSNNVDFGESIMRYDLSNGGFTISDAFTPFNQNGLTGADLDQGSGGILMLPDQPGTYPHLMVQVGKEGRILVLNRDGLGGYAGSGAGSNTNVVQDIVGPLKTDSGLWSTPAYWNGNVYMWASSDTLKMFPLTNGVLAKTYSSQSSATSNFPGPSPVISSNGTQNGIVWAVRTDKYTSNGSSVLYAFNPANVAQEYYDSAQKTADDAGQAVKFVVPVVANGKVYVGTWAQVDVYGLLNPATQAPVPGISPSGGTYTTAQQITLTDSVSGAAIYYTTDGSTPTASSTKYTGSFTLSTNATVQAIASASGYLQSPVASATYAFNTQTPAPQFSPTPGSYTSAQSVTITDTNTNAAIYYTTDGSTPTTSSNLYSGAITVSSNAVFNAIAVANGLTNSVVTTGSYLVQIPGTSISYPNGFSSVAGLTLNGSATNVDDSRLQLTTGLANQTGSVFYNTPTNIQAFTTDFAFQLSNAVADGFTFTIQNVSPTAIGGPGGGLGYGPDPNGGVGTGIANSVAIKFDFFNNVGEGTDSTGIFTDGATPTVPSFDMTSSGVVLTSGDTMDAHITYDGTNLVLTLTDIVVNKVFTQTFPINIPGTIGSNTAYIGFTGAAGGGTSSQKILSWTLMSNTPLTATPSFTPTAGTYTSAQSVTLADTTPGAVIYYTTNGTAPTTASAVYSGTAIPVAASETLEAIAVATGYTQSAVATAAYLIQIATATPTFTPGGGTYTTAQAVTLADTTPGAVIYYTTNGSTPTTASAVYGGTAIPVAASATLEAIAVATGYTQSAVATAAYVIQTATATPAFTPGGGTYAVAQSVTLADATPGAVIHYTTNGSTPTTASAVYGGTAIPVAASATLEAIAVATGYNQSAVATAAYVIQATTAAPAFSPAAGTYTSAQSITLTDAGATIYYTIDGSTPTTASAQYSAPIPIGSNTTVQAIAVVPGSAQSTVASATYVIQLSAPSTLNFAGGFPSSAGLQLNGNPKVNANYLELTDGGVNEANSVFWTTPVNIQTFTTNFTFQMSSAVGNGLTFTIQNAGLTAVGSLGGGLGYGLDPSTGTGTSIGSSVAVKFDIHNNIGEGTDSTGVYTNGAAPALPATNLTSSGITLASGDTISAQLVYNGTTLTLNLTDTVTGNTYSHAFTINIPATVGANTAYVGFTGGNGSSANIQNIKTWTFSSTTTPTAAEPVFNPTPGTYTTAQNVTLTAAQGATIYYTVDGSTPTHASPTYSAPIVASGVSLTIRAFASATGYQDSPIVVGTYQIQAATVATPVISPATGTTFPSTLNVSITDATAGSSIYYTTNGTTPTTGSTLYTGAFNIAASTSVQAIAVATGYTNSGVASAAYTLVAAGSGINYGAGFASTAGMTLNGTATNAGGSSLQVTTGVANQTGSAFYNTPINIQAFTNDFTFQLVNAQADGMTFTIQNVGPTAIGGPGGGLGYGPDPTAGTGTGIAKSVAVKFDFYNNSGEGTDSTGVYLNGASPTVPAVDMTSSGVVLTSGDTMAAHMTYDGTNLVLTLTDTVTAKVFTHTFAVNIPSTIGSNTAYIGFTGASGGTTAVQKILTWTLTPQTVSITPTPTFTPAAGTYPSAQSVTLTDAGATIYYTTDGTLPTTASAKYSAAIPVASNTTLQAIAVIPGSVQSAVASAAYVIQSSGPSTLSSAFAAGFPSTAGLQLNGNPKVNANYLELTDGGVNEANSVFWTTPVNIQTFTTNFTFQMSSAVGNGFTFTIQNAGLTAAGSLGGGLGYGLDPTTGTGSSIGNSVAVKFDIHNNIGEGTDSTGVYTNGAAPALPAVNLSSSGITLASGDTIAAQLVYNGTTLTLNLTDTVTGNTYSHPFTINIPATVGANTAYVGFTGGNGSSANIQNIKTWTLTTP